MIQSEKRRGNPPEPWQQVTKERNGYTVSICNFSNIIRVNLAINNHFEFLKLQWIKQHHEEPALCVSANGILPVTVLAEEILFSEVTGNLPS